MSNDEYKNCPYCSGKVNSGLIKCIYCGSLLNNSFEQDSSLIVNCKISWLGGNYYGETLVDKPHGYGVLTSPEGAKYSGEWRDGKPHGKGKLTDKNGGVYEGDFEHGKRHGHGVYNYHDGRIYDGEWKEGKYHLKGSLTNREGDTFTGGFKDGKKNGNGMISKKDGTIIDGEWHDDEYLEQEVEVHNNEVIHQRQNELDTLDYYSLESVDGREEYKRCPYCGEEIKMIAIKCKHCNSLIDSNNNEYFVKGNSSNNPLPIEAINNTTNESRLMYECPKCFSNKVDSNILKSSPWTGVLIGMGALGCLLLIPVIGWIIAVPVVIVAALLGLVNAGEESNHLSCQKCGHTWQYNKNL